MSTPNPVQQASATVTSKAAKLFANIATHPLYVVGVVVALVVLLFIVVVHK